MKKLLWLFLLLGFCAGCTKSPTEPKPAPAQDTYTLTVSFAPSTQTAYVLSGTTATDANLVAVTAVIRKNNAIPADRIQTQFQVSGGPLISESGAASWNTSAVNGTVTAHVYCTTAGVFNIKIWITVAGLNNPPIVNSVVQFVPDPHLSLTGISPATGTIAGGDTVTLAGTGFVQPLTIYFGTQQAVFISGTSTAITAKTPPHYPSNCNTNDVVDVKVVINPGQATEQSSTLPASFTYLAAPLAPTISAISPNHGVNEGGTLVTIYGTNFYCNQGVLVYFNNVPATVQAGGCSSTQLIVKAPPATDVGVTNCDQTVAIKVLNVCGGLFATFAGAFQYGPSIQINAWAPTQTIFNIPVTTTIYGQGFEAPMAVILDTVAARIINVSDSEVVVESGYYDPKGVCSDSTGPVVTTDINCGVTATSPASAWTYKVPKLYIGSLSPLHGTGGTTVTITGSGFYPPVSVTFGDSNAIVTSVSPDFTTITLTAPEFTGTYLSQTCSNTDGCTGSQLLPTPAKVTVTSGTTGCTSAFSSFFYDPPNANCVLPAPTCALSATVSGCGITWVETPVCDAAYTWTPPASCGNPGDVTFLSCNFAASGTYAATVKVTVNGQSSICTQTATIAAGTAGCP